MLGFIFRDYGFSVFLESIREVFFLMLVFCGRVALFYCYHYFGGDRDSYLSYPLMV